MRASLVSRAFSRGFSLVNQYLPWHKLPTWAAVMNLLAYRTDLRRFNLHDTSGRQLKTDGPIPDDIPEEKRMFRTIDGSYNDLRNPEMGMVGDRFGRNMPIERTWPDPENGGLLDPNPRVISETLLARDQFVPATILNVLAAAWIQFMTHDWFQHDLGKDEDSYQIKLKPGDSWPEDPMRIRRTPPDERRSVRDQGNPPTYRNLISHWWDASGVYGCDQETCDKLRTFEDGKLQIENGRLPVDPATGMAITGFTDNWWLGLGILHTLFALEHNAICDMLRKEFPSWSDERIYGTARLINSALMAKIHTVEWTTAILKHPALQVGMRANWWGLATEKVYELAGRVSRSDVISGIPGSPTDHHGVPFALTEEFSSVYRLHPLIPDEYTFYSLSGHRKLSSVEFPDIAFRNAQSILNGDIRIEDAIYSFGIAHPGAVTLHNFPRFLRDITLPDGRRLDLATVDILRDRERGVPRYNDFRELLRMPRFRTFEEMTPNKKWAKELKEAYDGKVDRVDLMVGMYSEELPQGFGFSDTAFRIFILMATRRLKSDRFFTVDYRPEIYTQFGLDWIQKNTMVDVLLRHYPDLAPVLQGVDNAFAPWQPVVARTAPAPVPVATTAR